MLEGLQTTGQANLAGGWWPTERLLWSAGDCATNLHELLYLFFYMSWPATILVYNLLGDTCEYNPCSVSNGNVYNPVCNFLTEISEQNPQKYSYSYQCSPMMNVSAPLLVFQFFSVLSLPKMSFRTSVVSEIRISSSYISTNLFFLGFLNSDWSNETNQYHQFQRSCAADAFWTRQRLWEWIPGIEFIPQTDLWYSHWYNLFLLSVSGIKTHSFPWSVKATFQQNEEPVYQHLPMYVFDLLYVVNMHAPVFIVNSTTHCAWHQQRNFYCGRRRKSMESS